MKKSKAMQRLDRELNCFFNAWAFFSRMPSPSWVEFSDEELNRSSRYFPLVGLIIGLAGALTYFVFSFDLPANIAVLLSMVVTVLLTGGFHEDGWADVCDAFGGGWDKPQILSIMKDSRIGTYGTLGLVFMLTLKFLALSALPLVVALLAMLVGHCFSRALAVTSIYCCLLYTSPSPRDKRQSRMPSSA